MTVDESESKFHFFKWFLLISYFERSLSGNWNRILSFITAIRFQNCSPVYIRIQQVLSSLCARKKTPDWHDRLIQEIQKRYCNYLNDWFPIPPKPYLPWVWTFYNQISYKILYKMCVTRKRIDVHEISHDFNKWIYAFFFCIYLCIYNTVVHLYLKRRIHSF